MVQDKGVLYVNPYNTLNIKDRRRSIRQHRGFYLLRNEKILHVVQDKGVLYVNPHNTPDIEDRRRSIRQYRGFIKI